MTIVNVNCKLYKIGAKQMDSTFTFNVKYANMKNINAFLRANDKLAKSQKYLRCIYDINIFFSTINTNDRPQYQITSQQ